MIKEKDIVFEKENYWILQKKDKTYEVYKNIGTHSIRKGIIGIKGEEGLKIAKDMLDGKIERGE